MAGSQTAAHLYSRVDQPPGTKGQTFSPGSNHHSGLLKMGCIFKACQNPLYSLYSRAVATPGTKGQSFSPDSNHQLGLKNL